jgi:hypothetical protein
MNTFIKSLVIACNTNAYIQTDKFTIRSNGNILSILVNEKTRMLQFQILEREFDMPVIRALSPESFFVFVDGTITPLRIEASYNKNSLECLVTEDWEKQIQIIYKST